MLFLERRPSNGPCEPRAVNDGRHLVIKAFSPSFFTYLMLNNRAMMMTLTHTVNFLFYCTTLLHSEASTPLTFGSRMLPFGAGCFLEKDEGQ